MDAGVEKQKDERKRFHILTVDPELMPPPHISPYLRLTIYIYYIFTSGCIYWGWNGLQEIFYKAGAYEDTCTDPTLVTKKVLYGISYIDCPSRAAGINNLYTVAYSTHFICSFVGGWMLDKLGPRICFMVGHGFSALAWLLVFCFPRNAFVLPCAFVIIGVFCEACYIPLLSVNMYFPNGNSTVMAIMGSCRSLSYLIPTLLAWIYHIEGFDRNMLYIIGGCYILIGNVLCFVSGAFLVPTVIPIPPPDALGIENSKECDTEGKADVETLEVEAVEEQPARAKLTMNDIKAAMRSKSALEFVILTMSVCLFMPSIEFINKSQGNLLVASGEGGDATGIFKYFNILTFVPAPFLGAFMDKVGPAIVMNFLHICAALYYVCASFDIYGMKIGACCCYLLAGSLCVSTIYCYTNKRFPKQYFGTLVTIVFLFAGSVALTNIPLYNWGLTLSYDTKETQFRPLAFVFLGYMVVASILSGFLVYLSNAKGRNPNKTVEGA